MCSSLSNNGEVEVFVKHKEVLHIAQVEIDVCEGEDYMTNTKSEPNVDQTPQYEDKGGSDYEKAEKDSFGDSDFIDNEYPISDDDDLYDNYMDANEEWIGVGGKEDKEKRVEEGYTTMTDVEDEKDICDDDIRNLSSDGEEEINKDKPRYPQFVGDTDMANLEFNLGLLFIGVAEFKATAREYVIKNGRNVKFVETEKDRVKVVCSKECPWVVYATEVRDETTFQVRTYNGQHTCSRVCKNNNKLSIGTFMNIVRTSLACEVSPSQTYRTKRKLPYYYVEMRTNSRTIVILETKLVEDKVVFQRIYMCFDACKRGFLFGLCVYMYGLVPVIEKLLSNS
ncbi:hypothetical protein PVL29_004558 [Vitis rotundifolia]|uniref:Transposase MuDR plant domain-containing protein n=1 Tax=Vitis rotundifolia TaxID=103349 RepID=A0AA39E0L1_VITRO|nr:hypothetical protein PVL29_004558 [Vitis rotundifolia]